MLNIQVPCKGKGKRSRNRPGVAQRMGRGIALPFQDRGTRRWWVVSSTLRPHLPPGKPRYPFYRRLGGPQGRSGRAEHPVPTGIRSRTFQPVVSRYTDWATRPTSRYHVRHEKSKLSVSWYRAIRLDGISVKKRRFLKCHSTVQWSVPVLSHCTFVHVATCFGGALPPVEERAMFRQCNELN